MARAAQEAVEAALRLIAELRELEPRGPVEARHSSAEELLSEVEQSFERYVPLRAIQGTTELLFGLGTVPADFDYRASLLTLMGTELAGLYDPAQKLMFLRKDLAEEELRVTLLHELVHALQDQHYGLSRVLEWREDATDESSALSGLAEGDATSAMLDAILAPTGQSALDLSTDLVEGLVSSSAEKSDVPAILKRSVIAPYLDGLRFVNAVRKQSGWAGVNQVWLRPPLTTEQLLHLDKYEANELGQAVALPPPPPGPNPWEVVFHDVWGEQSLRLLFEEWLPLRTAHNSAEGWGGDRIALFGAGDLRAVAWHVVVDTPEAAERMHVAFLRGIFPRVDENTIGQREAAARAARGVLCEERSDAGPFLALRRARSVVVVAGIYRRVEGLPTAAATCREAQAWAQAIARSI